MSDLEPALLRRLSGSKMVMASLVVGFAGTAPLLLYIAFGPVDGNPIGLGLLAVVAVPVAALGVIVGLISMLVRHVGRRGTWRCSRRWGSSSACTRSMPR